MPMSETIAAIRHEAGLTQEEMAQRLYVTRQAVSRWENNETAQGVDMDEFIEATADAEAQALGVSREEAVSLMATLLPHLDRWRGER